LLLGDLHHIGVGEAATAGGGVTHAVVGGGREVHGSVLDALIHEVAAASTLEAARSDVARAVSLGKVS